MKKNGVAKVITVVLVICAFLGMTGILYQKQSMNEVESNNGEDGIVDTDNTSKADIVTEYEGIKIVYDVEVKKYVRNSVIDYANSWFQRGFIIRGDGTSSC